MTTSEAFEELIAIRGWYKLCGIKDNTAQSLKRHYFAGKLSMGKQFELLESAGYKVNVKWKAG